MTSFICSQKPLISSFSIRKAPEVGACSYVGISTVIGTPPFIITVSVESVFTLMQSIRTLTYLSSYSSNRRLSSDSIFFILSTSVQTASLAALCFLAISSCSLKQSYELLIQLRDSFKKARHITFGLRALLNGVIHFCLHSFNALLYRIGIKHFAVARDCIGFVIIAIFNNTAERFNF